MDKLDDFVNNLQAQIFEEAKAAYGDKGFERWRNPEYHGRMAQPDAFSRVIGACGDTMEIYLKFEDHQVKQASYFTDGCASSQICGSFAAELAVGKNPDELIEITAEAVFHEIGRLPDEDQHCARLAAEAVQQALTNYMSQLISKTLIKANKGSR